MLPIAAAVLLMQAGPHARARLVCDVSAFQPGKPFLAGVQIDTDPGWHVYWQNPGDSGIPTTVSWRLPKGWRVNDLPWPAPRTFETGGEVAYGYEGRTLLLSQIVPPTKSKSVDLKASVKWLVCKEACVPGSTDLSLTLSARERARLNPAAHRMIQSALASAPVPVAGWRSMAQSTAGGYELAIDAPKPFDVEGQPTFLPFNTGSVSTRDQTASIARNRILVRLRRDQYASGTPEFLRGLLIAPKGTRWPNGRDAILVVAPVVQGE